MNNVKPLCALFDDEIVVMPETACCMPTFKVTKPPPPSKLIPNSLESELPVQKAFLRVKC